MIRQALKLKFLQPHFQKQSQLSQHQRYYFSERIRNFFEVDPLYPDFEDQDGVLFRDNTKQKFGSNQDKLEKIKKGHIKKMYGRSRQYVKKQLENEQKVKDLKKSNKEQKLSIQQRARQVAESILVDQETKLLFGFGFDDYIEKIKEKKSKDEEGEFIQKLQSILKQLKIKNDTELVQLYQYVIAKDTVDTYRGEARQIIIKRLLLEIQNMKADNKGQSELLDKYIDYNKSSKDTIVNKLENADQNDADIHINETELDQIASNIALQKIQKKIEVNKEYEAPKSVFKDKLFPSDSVEVNDDLFGFQKAQTDKQAKMGLNAAGQFDNLQDWKTEQIYGEIKQNFMRNKEEHEIELQEIQEQEQNHTEFFNFLEQDKEDIEIENYLRKNGLLGATYEKPEFLDVLQNIDFLIDSAPISLKSNLGNKSDKFNATYMSQDLSSTDLLWSNFENSFVKVFPSGKLPEEYLKDDQVETQEEDLIPETDLETIYDFGASRGQEVNISSHTFSEQDLEENERIELEVYRRIKTDPFFTHYIQNDLRFFSERMLDGYSEASRQMKLYDKSGDILNYAENKSEKMIQSLEVDDPEVQMTQKQKITNELKEKVFAGGKRKQARSLAILTKGSGKVTINKKPYLDYFPHPVQRNICMKPIYIANIPCMYDVDIHVRGGGTFGQCEAISIAVAKAVLKLLPHLRKQFVDLNLVQTDPRKKERKKMGQYKARKAWTYVRR